MRCPACNSPETGEQIKISRFNPPLLYTVCNTCQSYYQNPVPDNHQQYYNEDYYKGTAEFSYIDERQNWSFNTYVWKARVNKIRKYQKDGIFIDYGCAFGGLVRSAAPYFQSYGIDISPYAVKEGNRWANESPPEEGFMGLYNGSFENPETLPVKKNSVAVITMIELIEHLDNPAAHIQTAASLLKPGGLLVIQTANMEGWQALKGGPDYHYFLPGHLVCFTATGLKKLLSAHNLGDFIEFIPVEFGLLPKLKKARGGFKKPTDYRNWFTIALYHFKSLFRSQGRPNTSSYVLYAFKKGK